MSDIRFMKVHHDLWGRCVKVTNGIVEFIATLDVGPRIIRFALTNERNAFWEDVEDKFRQSDERDSMFGGRRWHIYGGHRLWTSPESIPRTAYPDNQPVTYQQLKDGMILTSGVEEWTQVQKEIQIHLNEQSSKVTVLHRLTNLGAWPIQCAVWVLSVMDEGGIAIIPHSKQMKGTLPNRVISLWSNSKMNDSRVNWGERFITVKQNPSTRSFKFGTNNTEGWAAYLNHGFLFVKSYEHKDEYAYPDHGVSFECFTNEYFLELETLSEYRTIHPQETITHRETWDLFQDVNLPLDDERRLESAISQYI